MADLEERLTTYYKTGQYKGFKKLREHDFKLSKMTHVTFSNGEEEVFASGNFKEQALKHIFDKIDEQDCIMTETVVQDSYLE